MFSVFVLKHLFVQNSKKRCSELDNICVSSPSETYFDIFILPEKWRLLVVVNFSLGHKVDRKMTFIATVTCSACHGPVCEFVLATYPLGPLDGAISHLVSKEELLGSLLPSLPPKSYFLSYLAPIARVSEGVLGFWKISSPSPFRKKGWSPFAPVRGARAARLSSRLSGQQCGPCLS